MSVRRHKKLNVLIELSIQIQSSKKIIIKHLVLTLRSKYIDLLGLFFYKFKSPLSTKAKIFQKALPYESPPRLCYESVAKFAAPFDSHVHFTTFKNSILVQKQILVKLPEYIPDECMFLF